MPACVLTNQLVSVLHCPPGRSHKEYFDQTVRGLYVDVLSSGRMSFRVRYRQGQRQRVYTLGDARVLTVEEARTQALALLRLVYQGGSPREGQIAGLGPTLGHFFQQMYLPFIQSYKRSWATDETLIRIHLQPALGHRVMGEVLAPEIAHLVQRMQARHYAPGTINRVLVLLRYGYKLALRWEVLGVRNNPAKELKNLTDSNKIERYLSAKQAGRLLEAVRASPNPALADIVAFLLLTGARKREALNARWQDVDWPRQLWRIPKTKSGKVRHVPLSSRALVLLKDRRRSGANDDVGGDWIFPNQYTGQPFVSIFHSWKTARAAAGLPQLRMHDLRHSFASFLVNAGRSLYEVQELLGHSDIRTTSRYAHLSRDRLRDAVEAVQGF